MDLKSAFDRIDRKVLWEAIERRGISKGIIEKVKEIYKSTKNVVKVNGKILESFWTEKDVRQGALNPILFLLLVADLEDEMKKKQVGRVQVRSERFWCMLMI